MGVWNEVIAERVRAHYKHGDESIESFSVGDASMFTILVEEIGEVAHAMTYDGPIEDLPSELIQVMAVCSAWLDKIREGGPSLEFINALQGDI
jgi:NTP pyrophosphatase (non-canonical NTP hydrolase)